MTAGSVACPKGRMLVGLALITLGVILTLSQIGVLNLEGIGRWWPLLIVGVGIVKARQPIEDGQRAVGVALLFVGGWVLLIGLLSWGSAWPLLMVLIGAFLLWQAIARRTTSAEPALASPVVSEFAFMAGVKRRVRVADFRGGFVTAVMGGVELDLRQSRIDTAPVTLDVVALWGGLELKVPVDWKVETRVVPFMGGFEDKSKSIGASDASPRLVVRGYAVMGVIIVSN